jgi:hypothetical protein
MNSLFNDYEGFIDKFKPKKTTDDCYTPAPVYDSVLNWVKNNCHIEGLNIVRPFYPGGDYENFDYEKAVVVDNPPFSILTKICYFFTDHKIKFFLFAPHLTLFRLLRNEDCQVIINDETITYANGARVNTCFVTNMFPGYKVLYRKIVQKGKPKGIKPKGIKKNNFPKNVFSAARIKKSYPFEIKKDEAIFTDKVGGMKIFGGGLIVSDSAAARIEAARIEVDDCQEIKYTASESEALRILNETNKNKCI